MRVWSHMRQSKLLNQLTFGIGFVLTAGLAPAFCQGGFDGQGIYELVNRNSNKVVDLDRNDRSTIVQFDSRGTDNQRWEIRGAPDNFFYIINMMNGQALEAMGIGDHDP